jgi:hypothetical protein
VLAVVDEGDDMDPVECARLHESLRRSRAQAKAGQLIDGDDVIGKLPGLVSEPGSAGTCRSARWPSLPRGCRT